MDPCLGRWILQSCGEQVGESWVKHTKRLANIFKLLFPTEAEILKLQHDACYDAVMTRMIYVEALRQARVFRQVA